MKKLLIILTFIFAFSSCTIEEEEGTIIFYSLKGSYDISVDGQSYGFVISQLKEPQCGQTNDSGCKTITLPTGMNKVKFTSRQGFDPIERDIIWEPGCKTYNIQ